MPSSSDQPLVSIGLPTYNRARLLQRALNNLTSQTWKNIELIVADNASTDLEVKEVLLAAASKDSRIRAITHTENIGAVGNFLFVLQQARGEYFMWAADDDEWDDDFISTLMAEISTAGLVMSDYETLFHESSICSKTNMPRLNALENRMLDATKFIANMQPSLVYGIYRTEALRTCTPSTYFDFWDCALVYSVLIRHGINTIPGYKYRAGVHGGDYEIKLASPSRKKLGYSEITRSMLTETWNARSLTLHDKARLSVSILLAIYKLRKHLNPLVKKQFNKDKDR
ncbi:glycosyltransferase family 2 protein [Aquipseudomonas alcaligenes]|uniref:glycosyltransferase family 2 protein n=1 Tax=Aquipseudomonas alcaligenes TaxID=43263 RepID=UPI0037479338